jgi:hypothetical protein
VANDLGLTLSEKRAIVPSSAFDARALDEPVRLFKNFYARTSQG